MSIISASLKNFKSYENVEIPEFHRHINVILGSNGHGKSNLIKALLFVFSDKIPCNRTEFENISHKGVAVDVKGNVEVIFELDLKSMDVQILKSQRMHIGRRWLANQGEEYVIDDKIVEKNHFSNVVQCLGLSYSEPYNIIQQGKITQISMMNEHDLYKLLQESTGIRKYMKKREQGLQTLDKLDRQKVTYSSYLQSILQKLKALEGHKRAYQQFEFQEGYRKRQLYRHYQNQLNEIQNQIQRAINLLRDRNKSAAAIINKKRYMKQELQVLQTNIGTLTQKLVIYRNEEIVMPTLMSQTEVNTNDKSLKELMEEKNQLQKEISSDKKQYQQEKEKFDVLKQQFENIRLHKSLANSGERGRLIQRSIREYNSEIETIKQSIKSYEKYLSQLTKFSGDQTGIRKQDIISLRQKHIENNRRYKIIQTHLQENKLQKILCNRRKNEIMIETESAKQNFLKESTKLSSRVNHLINFGLMNELRNRKIEGVYGYIVDHLQFEPDIAFAYDIATKNKYFSILVEDQSVAKDVIEVNKEIRGSKINLYTLSHLRRQPSRQTSKFPTNRNCQPLNNREWIRIKKHPNIPVPGDFEDCIEKLLTNTIGKYILVQEYSQGLAISKEYRQYNFITSKGEIIFSGGTFCKVGEMGINRSNKLLNYSKLLNLQKQLENLDRQDTQIMRRSDELDNKQAQLMTQFKQVEQDTKKTQAKLKESEATYKASELALQNQRKLKQSLFNSKKQIEKKEELKRNLEEKRTGKVDQISKQQFQAAQEKFKKANKSVNFQIEQIFLKEQKYDQISQNILRIERILQENRQRDEQSRMMESLTDVNAIGNIKKQIQHTSKQMEAISIDLILVEEELASIETEGKQYQERLAYLQINANQLNHKKAIIGQETDITKDVENDQFREKRDPSEKLRIFTAKDKALFNKYNDYKKEIDEYQDKLDYINQSQSKLRQFIAKSDEDANQSMNSTVQKFVDIFKQVMKRLESGVTCDVRLKKLNQKNQKDRFKNGLDIKVGFKSQEGSIIERKMRQLSGGQKSIIAIAFIISLQTCSTSPFYAFDEVDAALDIVYARKIADLLLELSRSSQYFLTTFKPHIIELAHTNASYWEVFNNERVSNVTRVNVERALEIVGPRERSSSQEEGQ